MKSMKVICEENGTRLDSFLAEKTGKTRSFIQKLLEDSAVSCNGAVVRKASYKVKSGDEIVFELPEPKTAEITPQDIPLEIVYEDDALLVVNKPQGMVVHPAPGNPDNTLVNAVMAHCAGRLSSINSVIRPGIVHRIDKDTSGLLVIAKTDEAHNHLAAQLKEHSMTRVYTCIVNGGFQQDHGTIHAPIGRHPVQRKKMAVTAKNAKDAVTHFEVLERLSGYTLLKCRLETGRTHQIRVHLAHIGHPLLGDPLYGTKNKLGIHMQMLHAGILGFIHPITGAYLEFSAPLPPLFCQVLEGLRGQGGTDPLGSLEETSHGKREKQSGY